MLKKRVRSQSESAIEKRTYRERNEREAMDDGTLFMCMLFTSTSVLTFASDENKSSARADKPVASRCRLARLAKFVNDAGADPPGEVLSPITDSVWSAESAPSSSGRFCGIPGAVSCL